MKRYIVKILLFFSIIAIIDISVGYIGDNMINQVKAGDTKRTNDLVIKDCHDILILGSSRARHHYDAPFLSDALGIDVYNAGYDGNGVILAYGLLEMILERYNPKLIIYDVVPEFDINEYEPDNNHKRYITMLKPYYWHQAVGNIIKDVSVEEWYKVHSGMMRYNMRIINMLSENFLSGKDEKRGYEPLDGVYDREPMKNKLKRNRDQLKLSYFQKMLCLAQSNGIPIVVVASPKYGMDNSEDIRPVKDICTQFDVPFLDYYSDAVFMRHKEWFKEPMHLNSIGAKLFSEKIIEQIENNI